MPHAGWEIDGLVVEAGRQHMGMQELEDSGVLVTILHPCNKAFMKLSRFETHDPVKSDQHNGKRRPVRVKDGSMA